MKNVTPIPYEAPKVTDYGTVQELTLGSGGTNIADISPCTSGSFRANTPSGFSCKISG